MAGGSSKITCKMASRQQKKCFSSSQPIEQCRTKKKGSSDSLLQAVAKREQVGITWMDMSSFVDSVPKSSLSLADVISIPQEIFDLNNLSEVLPYEVWETCLTESEREYLTQFLAAGMKEEQVVHSLLSGENHHFGNPVQKWSTSLCSGNLHPDTLVYMSRQLRDNRNLYYAELHKYHFSMINLLSRWKERWNNCKDGQKWLRQGPMKRKQGSLSYSSTMNEESLSNFRKRTKAAPISKLERLPIICIKYGDGTKNMSYIKISSEQYQMIKNSKPSGSSLTLESLRHVLGDLKELHVPKTCEKEEEKRVHEHWMKLVTKDIPTAYNCYRDKKLMKDKWGIALTLEIAEKRRQKDEKKSKMNSSIQEQEDVGDSPHLTTNVQQVAEDTNSTFNFENYYCSEQIPFVNSQQEHSSESSKLKVAVSAVTPQVSGSSPLPKIFKENDVSSLKAKSQSENNSDSFYHTVLFNLKQSQQPIEEQRFPVINPERGASVDNDHSVSSLFPHAFYSHGHCNGLDQPQLLNLLTNNSFWGHEDRYHHEVQESSHMLSNVQHPSHVHVGLASKKSSSNGEHRLSNVWSGVSPSASHGQYGNLYRTISRCNFNSRYAMQSSEQLIQDRNFITPGFMNDVNIYNQNPHF